MLNDKAIKETLNDIKKQLSLFLKFPEWINWLNILVKIICIVYSCILRQIRFKSG